MMTLSIGSQVFVSICGDTVPGEIVAIEPVTHDRPGYALVKTATVDVPVRRAFSEIQERRPFNVTCGACGHTWAAAYLPLEIRKFAATTKSLRCPSCAAGPKEIFVAKAGGSHG